MVDVGDKPVTDREAIARAAITMSGEARRLIRSGAVKKGDPLQAARLAGIMAAKQTSALIPLCHPLPLSKIQVDLTPTARGYAIEARVRTTAPTCGPRPRRSPSRRGSRARSAATARGSRGRPAWPG